LSFSILRKNSLFAAMVVACCVGIRVMKAKEQWSAHHAYRAHVAVKQSGGLFHEGGSVKKNRLSGFLAYPA
jgi:hypothetical protein